MRFVAIGRTRLLLRAIEEATKRGHVLVGVQSCAAAPEYGVDVEDFADAAARFGAPFRNDSKINSPETRTWLADTVADVAVSVNWPTRIRSETRLLFKFGVLNAHAGDLPRYRGNACPNWAILQGEAAMGVSVFIMGDQLDDGPVLIKRSAPISDRSTIGELYTFLEDAVPTMFADAIDGLAAGTIVAVPQPEDPSRALRCYPRRPEDSEIDWSKPASQIDRIVRASSEPFSGASTWFDGKRVRIWRSEIAAMPHAWLGAPGQVAEREDSGGVLVLCGKGVLRVLELEIDGMERGPAAQLVPSLRARFGLNISAMLDALDERIGRLEALISKS